MSPRLSQRELEYWWIEEFRANGVARAQKLRASGRPSSDEELRHILKKATARLHERTAKVFDEPSPGVQLVMGSLASMETLVLCSLTITAALNHILTSKESVSIVSLGAAIAKALEMELRIRLIEKTQPELMRRTSRGTFLHRNRGLMVLAKGRKLPTFVPDDDAIRMGLVELALLSDLFETYRSAPTARTEAGIWSIRARPEVLKRFNRTLSLDEFIPSVPPLGVYLEPQPLWDSGEHLLPRKPIVSANWFTGRAKPPEISPLVLKCINHLNKVPYRVNEKMLAFLRENIVRLGALGVVPVLVRPTLRTKEDHDTWHRAEGKRRAYFRTRILAEKLVGEKFYHDWFVDFRGRMYTTNTLLSPQGGPISKSLLLFSARAEVRRGEVSGDEFELYGARMVCGKKPPIPRGELENLARLACAGELGVDALDSPKDYLPFVAWALEAEEYFRRGAVLTGIMLRRDATASSIQHMATMARDEELMRKVNLSTDPPATDGSVRDLYADLPGDRKVNKNFIMTYSYNSTRWGRATQQVSEEGLLVSSIPGRQRLKECLVEDKETQERCVSLLAKVSEVRDRLLKEGEDSQWTYTTPSGLSWDGRRYEWPSKQVRVRYNGATLRLRLRTADGKPELNARKSRSAYTANVIHSLDASMLHLAQKRWPMSVAFIHDCVAARPGEIGMVCRALQRAFFEMHENLDCGVDKATTLDYDEYIKHSQMFV